MSEKLKEKVQNTEMADEADMQEQDKQQQEKIQEKLKTLLAKAKKKKNVLESQEIALFFADMDIQDDQMDRITDYLERQ